MIENPRIRFQQRDTRFSLQDQLRAVARTGGGIDASGGEVDAEELREACLAGMPEPGIRVLNARVVGSFDLTASRLDVPLHFFGCHFAEPVNVEGARLHELVISGGNSARGVFPVRCHESVLPGLRANGVSIARDLDISGTRISGSLQGVPSYTRRSAIWLTEAHIGGRFLAAATRIETGADRAIQADRTTISGDVRLINGFYTNAEVRLLAAKVGGSLDLTGAEIRAENFGRAIDVAEASIAGSLFMLRNPDTNERTTIYGRIEMGRAQVKGRMLLRWASLRSPEGHKGEHDYGPTGEPDGLVLSAPNLRVGGDLMIENVSSIKGGLNLAGAVLRGGLSVRDSDLANPDSIAINLEHAECGAGVSMPQARVRGQVKLSAAKIRGPIGLQGANLDQGLDNIAIEAAGVEIHGDCYASNLRSVGAVNFRSAQVFGTLDMAGAQIHNPGGRTLDLVQARVLGSVRLCDKFRSHGVVLLNRSVIDGRLRCDDGFFEWTPTPSPTERNTRGSAFEAISTEIRSGVNLGWEVSGAVDFTDAATSFLADRPERDWPRHCYLAGFRYSSFAPVDGAQEPAVWDAGVRAEWLAAQDPFDPRPWEHLASVLRDNGDPHGARRVLMRRSRRQLELKEGLYSSWLRRSGARIVGALTGYGHRPFRVIFVILGLIALTTVGLLGMQSLMRASPPSGPLFGSENLLQSESAAITATRCGNGAVRCFSPFLYAVDTVVPLVDLNQRSVWYPDDSPRGRVLDIVLGIFTLLGWFLSSLFVVALARDK